MLHRVAFDLVLPLEDFCGNRPGAAAHEEGRRQPRQEDERAEKEENVLEEWVHRIGPVAPKRLGVGERSIAKRPLFDKGEIIFGGSVRVVLWLG